MLFDQSSPDVVGAIVGRSASGGRRHQRPPATWRPPWCPALNVWQAKHRNKPATHHCPDPDPRCAASSVTSTVPPLRIGAGPAGLPGRLIDAAAEDAGHRFCRGYASFDLGPASRASQRHHVDAATQLRTQRPRCCTSTKGDPRARARVRHRGFRTLRTRWRRPATPGACPSAHPRSMSRRLWRHCEPHVKGDSAHVASTEFDGTHPCRTDLTAAEHQLLVEGNATRGGNTLRLCRRRQRGHR